MRWSLTVALVCAAGGAVVLSGCNREPAAPQVQSNGAVTPDQTDTPTNALPVVVEAAAIDVYESVKGRIVALPDPTNPADEGLRIHHEAMPQFKQRNGSMGMNEMVMRFPIGEGVSLAGFSAGDAVEFDFSVQWDGSPPYYITAIRPLPAGQELDLKAEESDDHSGHDHSAPHGQGENPPAEGDAPAGG